MTKEQTFFLTILKDHIHKQATQVPDGIDWMEIARYAKNHQVEGIVWYQCQYFLKSKQNLFEICDRLRKASLAEVYSFVNNQSAYKELEQEFQAQGVRYISVKGLNVAKLFPIPAYRTMGDMDILVATDDFDRVPRIMLKLGYHRKIGETVQCYGKSMVNYEIHNQLVNEQNIETAQRKAFFNQCWDYVNKKDGKYSLDWSFHFLFLIEHTKQHFSASGVGFRQFMDIAMVAMNKEGLDWAWIMRELKTINLWDFAVTAFAFCKRWWNFDSPFETPELNDAFFTQSTEFIFQNGVFGFDNENAGIHFVGKRIRSAHGPLAFRLFVVALRKVCISYNTALILPYCSFVRNRKYLLPIVWLYRVFYVVFHKKGNVINEVNMVFRSGVKIDVYSALMDRWGV